MRSVRHPVTHPVRSADLRAASGDPSQAPAALPRGSVLVRLGWMLGGTLVMLISVMMIASLPAWTFSLRDGVFWGAVLATGGLRYLDTARFGGQTTRGEPATPADLHRYLGGLAAVAVTAWIAAQSMHL